MDFTTSPVGLNNLMEQCENINIIGVRDSQGTFSGVKREYAMNPRQALENISETTLANISDFERGRQCTNEITLELIRS
jgi:hypothetical protein